MEVWQDAREYTRQIYILARKFPAEEKFGLISQIQRAAVSIPSNIAEGCGRPFEKEQLKFYGIAYGSLMETIAQLFLAVDFGYIKEEDLNAIRPLADKISAKLSILRKNIVNKIDK